MPPPLAERVTLGLDAEIGPLLLMFTIGGVLSSFTIVLEVLEHPFDDVTVTV